MKISLDLETASDLDLTKVGTSRYARHPSTRVLFAAWRVHGGEATPALWDSADGSPFPESLAGLLADPAVEKWAFNAAFERQIVEHTLGIKTPIAGWRCTMCLAYTQSFVGSLGQVGEQMGIPEDAQKLSYGRKLIRMFSGPQKPTRNQPHIWLDHRTNPREWRDFGEYCRQDVIAEDAIRTRLQRYPIAAREWDLYALDQKINDAGLPIDMKLVKNAIALSARRKAALLAEMIALTGLENPGSTAQLLAWLTPRGYPFADLQKDTVAKVLREDRGALTAEAKAALLLRQAAARAAVTKYDAIQQRVDTDNHLRGTFQFAGASRTGRWAGRGFQPTNLARTPRILEDEAVLASATNAIREGDMDWLELLVGEPLDALVGCVRSAIGSP